MSLFLIDPPQCFPYYFKTIVDPRKKKFGVPDTEMFALQNGVE